MDGVGVCQLHYRAVYMGAKLLAWHPGSVYISPVGTVGLDVKEENPSVPLLHDAYMLNVSLTLTTLSFLTERCYWLAM